MILNETQALALIKNPQSKREIESAKRQESALRVFTEELDSDELCNEIYWNKLQETIKTRSEKKYGRVSQFMRFPLPVVQITDSILNDFFKVFEGKNRYFNESSNNDIQSLEQWINENKPQEWIENQAKEIFKNKPCSFVVVDRKENGTPYLINVDTSRLLDAKFVNSSKDGQLEYISFIHSVYINELNKDEVFTNVSLYDDENFYVFRKSNKNDDYILIKSVKHNLGYCPARAFVNESSNTKNPFKRRSAFSQSLSKLEDWSIFDIYRNYTDHYAPFPVTEAPKRKCANNRCKDGVIEDEEIIDRATGEKRTIQTPCLACANESDLIGPGTHIKIKLQSNKDAEDGSGKFKMHFPETDKMQYIPDKLDDLELEIRYKSVGVSNILSKEAVNSLQVKGSFASMEAVLMRNKSTLDSIYKWSIKTVANLLYPNYKINIEGNFGTEFYLISEDELQQRFEKAKTIGLPKSELNNIYRQLISTKYKNNPDKLNRELIYLDINPNPFISQEEILTLKKDSLLDEFESYLVLNFENYISRFEIENGIISLFGNKLNYYDKINIIKFEIFRYNTEYIQIKDIRNNKNNEGGSVITQQQLDAQASLKGSVGGVQGILALQLSVTQGVTSYDSGISTLVEIYGFTEEIASKILGLKN